MLDDDVFATKMGELLALFPSWEPEINQTSVAQIWYDQFRDLTDNEFKNMVDSYIANEKFNPTVGGLRRYVVKGFRKSQEQINHENMLKENGLK